MMFCYNILLLIIVLLGLLNCCFCSNKFDDEIQRALRLSKNVSKILDKILKGYDKRLRPNYAGQPVVVGITININNINSVSEVNMDYTLDMYIRQYWTDKRLSFEKFDNINELVIGSDMLHRIWTPDTFLANERKSYFHKSPSHNKFIRISPNGQVLFSMRLTVTAACPMNFRYFPMDHQECHLEIESYGFRYEDIQYKWATGLKNSLDIAPGIILPQLSHKGSTLKERKIELSTGIYSRLTMTLYFMRNLGYYIIQIYIPSSMIVIISWVSFWLDRTAAPARVALGITTVLTMVTFIWSTNASLPKISYIKSIDVYLICCFFMTFASVIEYAIVSFIHHRYERKKRKLIKDKTLVIKRKQLLNGFRAKSIPSDLISNSVNSQKTNMTLCTQALRDMYETNVDSVGFSNLKTKQNETNRKNPEQELMKIPEEDDGYRKAKPKAPQSYKIIIQTNGCCIKACKIDNYSRIIFPAVFLAFHIAYWLIYLQISATLS